MNKLIIMGRLGQDPEEKNIGGDTMVTNFSVATSRKYFSKKEDKQVEDVQWHSCSAFGKTGANIAKYLKKGDPILLEGALQYRAYEKDGVKAKATNVLVDRFEFISVGRGGDSEAANPAQASTPRGAHQPVEPGTDLSEPMPF